MNTIAFTDPRSMSPADFEQHACHTGVHPSNVRALLGAIVGEGDLSPDSWSERGLLPRRLAANIELLPALRLEKQSTSPVDGFHKLLFRTHDDLPVETVIIPLQKANRRTVCLSSQVGCVMGCAFCATARMPQRRNLTSWEILDQMRCARRIASEAGNVITGAVFMGMGEPFLNYHNVMIAAEHLCFPVRNAISSKAITISTVGIIDKIDRFTAEKRPFRLSISLGGANDTQRQELVPVAARRSIHELIAAAGRYARSAQTRVNIAYVCISGVNVSVADAQALGDLLKDVPVRLDLIDVTDHRGIYAPPTARELQTFRDALNIYLKQPVARRYSGGKDIRAACGTLAGSA